MPNERGYSGMKSYSSYKDSGVEWIGEIPSHWTNTRLKYVVEIGMGQSIGREKYNFDKIGIPFLQGCAEFGTKNPHPIKYSQNLPKLCDTGTILLSVRAPVGRLNVADQVYGIGRGLCAIVPIPEKLSSKFTRYLLEVIQEGLQQESTGSTYDAVSVSDIEVQPCVFPPKSEQKLIEKYLEIKTCHIDDLVNKIERKIELLKEQRSSLIGHCVTKGLDTNVEVKDSGVEWIGEIPSHWTTTRLKYVVQIVMGQSIGREKYNFDKIGIPFLQGCAEFGKENPHPIKYSQNLPKLCDSGAVLLSVRAPVGRLNVADQVYGIGRGLCSIVPIPEKLSSKFTRYLFEVVREGLQQVSTGSTYDAVSVSDISDQPCAFPPKSEQKQISNYLDHETLQIDRMVDIEAKRVELLREYRRCLISSVVTGKIDVRDEVYQ